MTRFALHRMERETGIEPATNSLEGCDSTTELLPRLGARPIHFTQPKPLYSLSFRPSILNRPPSRFALRRDTIRLHAPRMVVGRQGFEPW